MFDDGIDMTKAMYGVNAIQVPAVLKIQDNNGLSVIVGYSQGDKLRFGSKLVHQLVICDIIVRPHLVMESDKFAGSGASGLLKQHPTEWERENIILNPLGLDTADPIADYLRWYKK